MDIEGHMEESKSNESASEKGREAKRKREKEREENEQFSNFHRLWIFAVIVRMLCHFSVIIAFISPGQTNCNKQMIVLNVCQVDYDYQF